MTTGEVVTLPPGSARRLIQEGKMSKVAAPEPKIPLSIYFEKVKELFGKNFLGGEALVRMEGKCQRAGMDILFDASVGDPPYSIETLVNVVSRDKDRGRERLFVLRPKSILRGSTEMPVTIEALWNCFKDKNPFGTGNIFYENHWFHNKDFAKEPLRPGWRLPTKDIVTDSIHKTWSEQSKLLESWEGRRTAVEAVWDLLFYYAVTGEKLLQGRHDWTTTGTVSLIGPNKLQSGVLVGNSSEGLEIANLPYSSKDGHVGVCPTR